MAIWGFVAALLPLAIKTVKMLTGKETVNWIEVMPELLAKLPAAIENAVRHQGYDTKEKFDAWLETFDATTGQEEGALDLIRSMPNDVEEQMLDHVKEAARIMGYNLIGVDGYKVEAA